MLARAAVEDREDARLARVRRGALDFETLAARRAQRLQVDLPGCVACEGDGKGAAGEDEVFEVGALFYEVADFVLWPVSYDSDSN